MKNKKYIDKQIYIVIPTFKDYYITDVVKVNGITLVDMFGNIIIKKGVIKR